MPLQLRGTFPVEGKANENPVEHSTRPITNDRRTFREAETRLGVEKLCVSLHGLQGHFGRVKVLKKRQSGTKGSTPVPRPSGLRSVSKSVANLLHFICPASIAG